MASISANCKYCGKEFLKKQPNQMYCSPKCKDNQKSIREKKYRTYYRPGGVVRPLRSDDTLCWICKNATGGCSWSQDFTPVEGWTAIPTQLKKSAYRSRRESGVIKIVSRGSQYESSFFVKDCPKFEPDDRIKEYIRRNGGELRNG